MRNILKLFPAFFLFACSSPQQVVELGELDVKTFTLTWGEAQVNKSISGNPLSVAGTTYEKGVGVHADSEGYIRLDGKKGRFTAYVGVDDHAGAEPPASVVFHIFTNKGLVFSSGVMTSGDAPKPVDINLKGVTDLYLMVESTSDGHSNDHANWLDAKYTVSAPPVAMKHEVNEERYILTPPPALAPRINGAKITGASPAKPFLFTIAASGERPMTFETEGLPDGLTLNKEKGTITGVCKTSGSYLVPVIATNSHGMCRDTIEIVIGSGLALTPHMGWNSWYFHTTEVTQEIMEKSAQAMHDERLIDFGYTYVNIDDGWEIKVESDDPVIGGPVRNRDGTIRPNKNFPDMKRLTDYIHNLGLKAGLYSSPGHSTCGGYAGSLGYEAKDIKTFSDWGFDFLKYDWCSYGKRIDQDMENLQRPYRLISELIKKADRDIILNMCQYGWGEVWKWGKEVGGNSWRTTGDLGASPGGLLVSMFRIGFFQEQLKEYSGPDGWNDPDYLLFGNIYDWEQKIRRPSPYSPSEHYTCMTLWCMMAAPLIFSGEMTTLDDFTKNVLCNAEVIAVNQDKSGKPGYGVSNKDLVEIWKRELSDGTTAIAVFNKRPIRSAIEVDWTALGYADDCHIRDLWRQIDLGTTKNVKSFDIPRHGCVMLKMGKQ